MARTGESYGPSLVTHDTISLMDAKVMNARLHMDGYVLKVIACITMFIDHLTYIFLESRMPETGRYAAYSVENGVLLDAIGRGIGRMAMPIYCFLLVEGYCHTRSRARYLLRLSIFAVLSQVPFWLMDGGMPSSLAEAMNLNVMVTLAYGLVAIWIVDVVLLRYLRQGERETLQLLWRVPVAVAAAAGICALAEVVTPCDYGAGGVILILLFYLLRSQRAAALMLGYIEMAVYSPSEVYAMPAMVLLWFYNGERGRRGNKYFFYLFYPLHILLILGVRYMVWGY